MAKRFWLGCLLGLGPEEVEDIVELSLAQVVVEDHAEDVLVAELLSPVLLESDPVVELLMTSSQVEWLLGPPELLEPPL